MAGVGTDVGTELVIDIFKAISAGDYDALNALVDPDYEEIGPFPVAPGREGFVQLMQMWRGAFPDFVATPEDIIVEGNRAAWRLVGSGTHLGELAGIPATGKKVTFSSIDMGEMKEGKAIRHWSSPDMLGLFTQLGVVPPLGG